MQFFCLTLHGTLNPMEPYPTKLFLKYNMEAGYITPFIFSCLHVSDFFSSFFLFFPTLPHPFLSLPFFLPSFLLPIIF